MSLTVAATLAAGLAFAAGVQASGVSCDHCTGTYSGTWSAVVNLTGGSATLELNWKETLTPGPGGNSAWNLTSASGTVGFNGGQDNSCSASLRPNPALARGLGNTQGPQVEEGSQITVDPYPPTYWSSDPQTRPEALISSPDTGNSLCDGTSLQTAYEDGWTFTGPKCHTQISVPIKSTRTTPDNCTGKWSDSAGDSGTATLTSTLTIGRRRCTCSCSVGAAERRPQPDPEIEVVPQSSARAFGSRSAHVASGGPVAVSLSLPGTPGDVRGFGVSIVATPANGCPDYTFLWKLVKVEHDSTKPNYVRVTPTVKGDGPAKQSTLHVKLQCRVPARVRRVRPDYWTRPCQSTITYLVRVTDSRGKRSLDKDSTVKFNWRPECLTEGGVARIQEDEKRITDEALADLPADLRSEALQHGLTTLAEWESLGTALLARGALGLENKIGSLIWSWELDQDWLQNRC